MELKHLDKIEYQYSGSDESRFILSEMLASGDPTLDVLDEYYEEWGRCIEEDNDEDYDPEELSSYDQDSEDGESCLDLQPDYDDLMVLDLIFKGEL